MSESLNRGISTTGEQPTANAAPANEISIGHALGRFLSNFSYVLRTLGFYVFLSLFTLIWLWIELDGYRAITITYDVATGGNPLAYMTELQKPCPFLWGWIVIFHILAWLVVPVLAATAIDAAYREWEERKEEAEQRLRQKYRAFARERLHLSGSALDDFEDTWITATRQLRKKK